MAISYSVIIPAYNEEASVERAVRETAGVFDGLGKAYEIIVVDDGSSDRTAASAMAAGVPAVRVLRHETNQGKGAAVRTGVMNAGGELILFMDCDLATHPSEATAFIKQMGDCDIAIGSRRHAASVIVVSQPWYRVAYGRLVNLFIRRTLGLPYHDTQCGFKMFRAAPAREIFRAIGPSRWTFDAEVLLRARAAGYRIVELPIAWRNGASTRVKSTEVIADLGRLLKLKKQLDK